MNASSANAVKVIVFVLTIVGICASYLVLSARFMGDCRERGGQVERVYGGSGWICEGDE